jgi:AcrR family transcriptional regulator
MAEAKRTGLRARVRAEMIEEIKQIALRQLEVTGADLSLRAVSRELGMVSSAIYRYFPSRDDLLTALIIDGYNALGEAAEVAEAAIPRSDLRGRFVAVGRSLREWAVAHQAEYALLYGSPVPGYQAPADTVGPAGRAAVVFGDLLREAAARGRFEDEPSVRLPKQVRADLEVATRGPVFEGVPVPVADRAAAAWVQMFGAISLELFGHLVGTIDHPGDWFEHRLKLLAVDLGL